MEPGDALLNVSARSGPRKGSGERTLEAAYPYGLARLRDVSAGLSPQQSATLGGTYASASVILRRLTQVRRLWVVEWTTPKPVLILDGLGFTLVHRWEIKGSCGCGCSSRAATTDARPGRRQPERAVIRSSPGTRRSCRAPAATIQE
jgi:hypothetical protein